MDADQAYRSRSAVLIVQDRLHFGERWQALAGLRAERLQAHSEDWLGDERHEGRSSLLSPRLGLVYTPRPGLWWFASWSQSSRPQLGVATADGQLLPPEEGRQIEGGLQWGRAERGLVGTLSVYRLQRSHLATTDTRNPSFSVAGGRRESRGIELELRGEPARGMQLDLSVEALRARVVKDNDVPSGTALPGVAPWFLSLWLTQQLDEAWTLGAGLVGEGRRRAAMPPNELRLPSYATMDLSLAYRASGWRLQLGLGNVFGRRALVSDGYAVRIVDPRNATLVLSASL
jgi:iron complex outermembrane receptor protein